MSLSFSKQIHDTYEQISLQSCVAQVSHLAVVDDGDCVVISGLDHPVHQLPLSGEGVELQDLIRIGTVRVFTA